MHKLQVPKTHINTSSFHDDPTNYNLLDIGQDSKISRSSWTITSQRWNSQIVDITVVQTLESVFQSSKVGSSTTHLKTRVDISPAGRWKDDYALFSLNKVGYVGPALINLHFKVTWV